MASTAQQDDAAATRGADAGAGPRVVIPANQAPNIYVGDLNEDVNESDLNALFSPFGTVVSQRILRDSVTRRSLGYGYVNFQELAAAQAAIENMNYRPIRNRPCRIMWAQRDPFQRRSGIGNLFIRNLPDELEARSLWETCSMFGPVMSVHVPRDAKGATRGFGFVQYDSEENAKKAIQQLNGMDFNGRKLVVEKYLRRQERQARQTWSNLYIKNIPKTWTDEDLKALFAPFGTITSAVVMRDASGVSRGFGFVNLSNQAEAEAALSKLHDSDVKESSRPSEDGNNKEAPAAAAADGEAPALLRLYVSRAMKRNDRMREMTQRFRERHRDPAKNTNLYIKGLSEEVDDDKLLKLFAPYGSIKSAKVMKDASTGMSKLFGFVAFTTHEEADKARAELHGTSKFDGKKLYVQFYEPKDERAASKAQQTALRATAAPARGAGAAFGGAGGAQGMYGQQQAAASNPYGMYPQVMPGMMTPQMLFAMMQQMMVQMPGAYGAQQTQQRPAAPPMQQQQQQQAAAAAAAAQRGPGMMAGPGAGAQAGVARGPVAAAPGNMPPGRQVMAAPGTVQPQRMAGPAGPAQPGRPMPGAPMQQMAPGARPVQSMPYAVAAAAPPAARPAAAAHPSALPAEFRRQLLAESAEKRHNMLGEKLYPLVMQQEQELAGKITGMLLELDTGELLHLLEDPLSLRNKVAEAVNVLRYHSASA